MTDEELERIKEFDKHKALMEEPPEGVDPRAIRRNQALRAKRHELDELTRAKEVGDK